MKSSCFELLHFAYQSYFKVICQNMVVLILNVLLNFKNRYDIVDQLRHNLVTIKVMNILFTFLVLITNSNCISLL